MFADLFDVLDLDRVQTVTLPNRSDDAHGPPSERHQPRTLVGVWHVRGNGNVKMMVGSLNDDWRASSQAGNRAIDVVVIRGGCEVLQRAVQVSNDSFDRCVTGLVLNRRGGRRLFLLSGDEG